MPNFYEVTRKEDVVISNINRIIGRFRERESCAECTIEKESSEVITKLMETAKKEIMNAIEDGYHLKRNVSGIINRVSEQLKFREEIATCDFEEDIYKDAVKRLEIILEEYTNVNQQFPKMWVVCEVAPVHGRRLK